jgi:putative FmdB family regulatory protein
MARMDLVCKTCRHTFTVATRNHLKDEEKRCPQCGSASVRQTFASYMRNGPLLDPDLRGGGGCSRSYG